MSWSEIAVKRNEPVWEVSINFAENVIFDGFHEAKDLQIWKICCKVDKMCNDALLVHPSKPKMLSSAPPTLTIVCFFAWFTPKQSPLAMPYFIAFTFEVVMVPGWNANQET